MNADLSDAETEAALDSAELTAFVGTSPAVDSGELAGMVGTNPELEYMPELLEEGREIAGRYRIIRHLGSGGMGNVYLAEHTAIGKQVALKTLSVEYARRKVLRERFLREARSASQIRHPNVVDITDFGSTEEGAPFIAMEFLDGEDLKETLDREGRLSFEETRELIVQVCRALSAAHDQGIVHRDVKPANCFRIHQTRGPDIVKVVDFGIAKTTATGDSTELTKTGVIVGTAAYMSPEQARGEADIDARADVYSVGVILFRMLTGKMPYNSTTPLGMITKHLTEPIPSVREVAPDAKLAPAVDAIVQKALAKQREDRFQSAAELAEALQNADDPATLELIGVVSEVAPRPSRVGAWIGLAAAVAVVAVGGVLLFGDQSGNQLGNEAVAAAPPAGSELGPEPAPEVEVEIASTPDPEPASTTVTVRLSGAPEGAVVVVDGRELGPASEPVTLERGDQTVSIEVQAPGHASTAVAVVPLADLELPVTLTPLEPEVAPSKTKKKRGGKKQGGDTSDSNPSNPVDKEIGF